MAARLLRSNRERQKDRTKRAWMRLTTVLNEILINCNHIQIL